MISQTLREARKYEEAMEPSVSEEERPLFHLSARIGWMNDPNGFSWYKDQFHLFYQYYPYDTHWGPMHWGHVVSADLLHWTYLPAALAPDAVYDRDGVFSGSAITLEDGRHLLLYTGVAKTLEADGQTREVQTQCIAVGDGIDYQKILPDPVIGEDLLPVGSSHHHFRDPKIWQRKDGTYRALVGSLDENGSGQLLLFGSRDCFHWDFKKVLVKNNHRFGVMWECPDFFALNGKYVILASPQDMLPMGFEYHNGNGTLCLLGDFDEEEECFTEQSNQAIDYGIDFYAPQTILTPDGRRVMIGWMQNWDTCNLRANYEKWYGQMSLPRELFIQNGRLCQKPLRELEMLRGSSVTYTGLNLQGRCVLDGIKGRTADMTVVIRPADDTSMYRKFSIHIAENEAYHTSISFRPGESILKLDRKFSGSRRAIIHQRRSLIPQKKPGEIKLRLILDRYSVEVFVNNGEQVMSATFYTPLEAEDISFFVDGHAGFDVTFYPLSKDQEYQNEHPIF